MIDITDQIVKNIQKKIAELIYCHSAEIDELLDLMTRDEGMSQLELTFKSKLTGFSKDQVLIKTGLRFTGKTVTDSVESVLYFNQPELPYSDTECTISMPGTEDIETSIEAIAKAAAQLKEAKTPCTS